ncbi:hypothetical protein ACFSKW_39530 [Nonomuraea mangrovi]|uniref:Uncharacterized protein n=1 Tax=Nonomuraea mangrovi TaxID=2316207 RepID=A0ABW4T6J1_9ACTN
MKTCLTIVIAAGLLAALPATVASASTSAPISASAATGVGAGPSTTWGPMFASGRKAVTQGRLTVLSQNTSTTPTTATVQINGAITDLTKGSGCGWAIFRISFLKKDASVATKHHYRLDCTTGTPKSFSFVEKQVVLVETKVCSEIQATKPSATCLYGGSWKKLYSYLD